MAAESSERGKGYYTWAMGLASLFPVGYVLSTGPVYFIAERLGVSESSKDVIRAIYGPLVWLHNHTPVREPLQWYLDLWGVK